MCDDRIEDDSERTVACRWTRLEALKRLVPTRMCRRVPLGSDESLATRCQLTMTIDRETGAVELGTGGVLSPGLVRGPAMPRVAALTCRRRVRRAVLDGFRSG